MNFQTTTFFHSETHLQSIGQGYESLLFADLQQSLQKHETTAGSPTNLESHTHLQTANCGPC